MKAGRILVLILGLLSTFAPLAHAQFGSGIVYDPTQSAHALQQIEQGSQIYTTAVATRNQIVTMYNLAYQMSQLPQEPRSAVQGRLVAVDQLVRAAEHLRQHRRLSERTQLWCAHHRAAGV